MARTRSGSSPKVDTVAGSTASAGSQSRPSAGIDFLSLLPLELTRLILDHLRFSIDTKEAHRQGLCLASVCRAWQPEGLAFAYKILRLDGRGELSLRVIHASQDHSHRVRELTFWADEDQDAFQAPALGLFEHFSHLSSLDFGALLIPASFLISLGASPAASLLQKLSISIGFGDPAHRSAEGGALVTAFRSFTSLQHLRTRSPSLDDPQLLSALSIPSSSVKPRLLRLTVGFIDDLAALAALAAFDLSQLRDVQVVGARSFVRERVSGKKRVSKHKQSETEQRAGSAPIFRRSLLLSTTIPFVLTFLPPSLALAKLDLVVGFRPLSPSFRTDKTPRLDITPHSFAVLLSALGAQVHTVHMLTIRGKAFELDVARVQNGRAHGWEEWGVVRLWACAAGATAAGVRRETVTLLRSPGGAVAASW
ncbi:hypothetical protein JCM8097_004795 [Rhodosporidiobolus ruineniae]